MPQGPIDFFESVPSSSDYRYKYNTAADSPSSAFTVEAEPSPVGALLDMVTRVTLSRIIFEEAFLERHGLAIQPVIKELRKAETEIWQMASQVLIEENLQKLRSLIAQGRAFNPEIDCFPSIRFSDFSAIRGSRQDEVSRGCSNR